MDSQEKHNKRRTGTFYETQACRFLEENHIRIVERNFRNRTGEIDIIGYDKTTLVFFEVKYRKNEKCGLPEEAVTIQKQRNICRVADYYRIKKGIGDFSPMRYDVIAICGYKLKWYKNAFMHIS